MLIALIVFRIGWGSTIYCQQILLGMLTIFGPIQWAFSLLPKWESAWAKWLIRYLTVHFYGAMIYFVIFTAQLSICKSIVSVFGFVTRNKPATKMHLSSRSIGKIFRSLRNSLHSYEKSVRFPRYPMTFLSRENNLSDTVLLADFRLLSFR